MKQLLSEFTISLTESDAAFMKQLSATTGDFKYVLKVLPNDVIQSTGMIAIPSGIITVEDVGRALSAAMPPEHNDEVILPASTSCHYLVDGSIQTEFMPIGMPAKKLQVTISVVKVRREKLRRWLDWPAALERNLVGWRIEVASAHD